MFTDQADEEFDEAGWQEALRAGQHAPGPNQLDHRDFWKMYCAGGEL
jgi:hypothetical protein